MLCRNFAVIIVLTCLLFPAVRAWGQHVEWQRMFSSTSEAYWGEVVTQLPGGDLLVTGHRSDSGIVIIRLTPDGVTRWQQFVPRSRDTLSGLSFEYSIWPAWMIQNQHGELTLVGTLDSYGDPKSGYLYIRTMDTDRTNVRENFIRKGPVPRGLVFVRGTSQPIVQKGSGYVVANMNKIKESDTAEPVGIAMMAADSAGILTRKYHYPSPRTDEDLSPAGLFATRNGGLVCLNFISDKSTGKGLDSMDVFKVDSSYELVWRRRYCTENCVFEKMCVTDRGDMAIVMFCYTTDSNALPIRSESRLLVLDEKGELRWDKRIGIGSHNCFEPLAITYTPDNGYIIGGYTGDYRGSWLVYEKNMALIRLDAQGGKRWEQEIDNDSTDRNGLEEILGICRDNSGGYVVTGATRANKPGIWGELYVAKITENTGSVLYDTPNRQDALTVHPNPATNWVDISVNPVLFHGSCRVGIYDMTGVIVYAGVQECSYPGRFSVESLPNGLYRIVIRDSIGQVFTAPVIIAR